MTWQTVTTIHPSGGWQLTEPVEGEFFRLAHVTSDLPTEYFRAEVAQVEMNGDVRFDVFDLQEIEASAESQIIQLPKPACFSERRIAIRSLRDEVQLPPYGRPYSWAVAIEVSDAVSGGGSSEPPAPTTKELTFNSSGDANGLLYWLGTGKSSGPWQNPFTAGFVQISQSSAYSSAHDTPQNLCDRQPNETPASSNIANSYFEFDFNGLEIKPNHYSIRGRDAGANHPRNWRLLGSTSGETWAVIDEQTSNGAVTQNAWFSTAIASDTFYKKFRFQQTGPSSSGDQVLTLGEIEFYGTVKL
jgi:hypothetical protein